MKTKPSAMPWKSGTHRQIVDATGNVICELWSHMGIDEADANEEIIVRAVNSYDDLVRAAREIIRTELFFQDHPEKYKAQQALRAVLAKASHD